MKILSKTIECGEYIFQISTDRDIAVRTFEEFPGFVEKAMNGSFSGKSLANENETFLNAVKERRLNELFCMADEISEIVNFALPMMLKKAGGDESFAKTILNYARENEADIMLNNAIFEFVMQGFTQSGLERTPKIKFAVK